MPEVEKIEEEPIANGILVSFAKKLGFMPGLGINPSKRFHLTLKETVNAQPELVTVCG